jgi:hypothetical protein
VTAVDLALAVAGRSYAAVSGFGRNGRRARLLMGALLALSLVPVLGISLISIPLERSFEELRQGRYRERTSWLRLEGELRAVEDTRVAPYTYVLEDPRDPGSAVTIYAEGPLPTGHQDVTGRPLGGVRQAGTFEAFYADVPTEPARHDPWLLIALPALLAGVLAIGERVGYPIVRGERVLGAATRALDPDETVPARWSGRIGGEFRAASSSMRGTAAVTRSGGSHIVNLADGHAEHTFAILPARPKVVGRVCRIGGCTPGIELHAPRADVILEFEADRDRDRIVASLDRATATHATLEPR